jgi:hypothetical protein
MDAREIWERALAGGSWLVGHQRADGGWIGVDDPKVDAFYKGSWALTSTGHLPSAQRLLDHVRQRYMTAAGDFLPRDHPWHTDVHYLYASAYFVVGAMVSGRYEIAYPAASFMLGQQDLEHGGFYSRHTAPGQRGSCDTMSAGAAGMACLAVGQLEAARRAGDFLRVVIERQPDAETRFYTTMDVDGRLVTEFASDEAFAHVIEAGTTNQCWYALGLPFAFLIRLFEATGETRYRALAQWAFDFQARCVDPWAGGSSGKAGWGSAMLYRITGDARYREVALEVAQTIADTQRADGAWLVTAAAQDGTGALGNADLDVTAEYTLWCALIAANLLARDAA